MSEKNTSIRLDAFCNPIVVGKTYGYTSVNHGINRSYIGTLVKINNAKVTLKVKRMFISYLYQNMGESVIKPQLPIIVKPSLLIPL